MKLVKKLVMKFFYYIRNNKELKKLKKNTGKEKIILFGTPSHGNLGDHFIAEAQNEFFKQNFPDKEVVEITGTVFYYYRNFLKKYITKEDILFVSGGGFLGSLWPNEEDMVRKIFSDYKKNMITIFPQTIYYDEKEEEFLLNTISIYKNHRAEKYIFLRDSVSYDFVNSRMKDIFNGIYFSPDIVLYLDNEKKNNLKSHNVLFCMRKDKEKVLKDSQISEINQLFLDRKFNISYTDTVIEKKVSIGKRRSELDKKINEFLNAKLVVTDRLHGMIICAITGTPCIAFDNTSKKVSGVYEWLQKLNYIHQLPLSFKVDEEFQNSMEYLLSISETDYKSLNINKEFEKMNQIIKGNFE